MGAWWAQLRKRTRRGQRIASGEPRPGKRHDGHDGQHTDHDDVLHRAHPSVTGQRGRRGC